MLVALTPRAGAQGEQSCFSGSGKEISFENEASFIVDFAIFNPDGTSMTPWLPVLPDEHENGCDVSIGLKSGPVECTRSCQDGNDPGTDCGDTPSEWGGYLCLIPDQLITLGFRANVPGEGWEYHFFAHTWNPSLSEFYTPFTVPSYPTNQDTHFRYYEGKGERRMLTSIQLLASPLQFIEDFIGDTWVLPYNLDYVCAQPGADCSHPYTDWNVFVTPVEGVEKLEGEEDPPSFPPYTFAAESDVVVPTNYTWDWDVSGLELRFPSGQRLTVEGDLTADGVTFTEADEGQGWGGIDVLGTGADLDLENGAVVEHAATGVTVFDGATASIANSTLRDNGTGLDVRSSAGTTVSGSTIRHNTTGIRADIVQEEPGAPVACFGPCLRSDLDVFDSVIRNNSGVGLAAYFADVEVRDTEIRDNSSYGIYASSTTMNPFTGNLVVSNGSTGALAGTGADLFLSPTSAIGENRIASNTTSEVAVAQGGFAFLGDDTGLTGDNAVFDPAFDPSSGFRLVKNDSKRLFGFSGCG